MITHRASDDLIAQTNINTIGLETDKLAVQLQTNNKHWFVAGEPKLILKRIC